MAFCCASIAIVPLHAGTEVLLYPFARAFGSPKEADLVKCREAFRQFQAGMSSSSDAATSVLVMTLNASMDGKQEWRADLAGQLAQRVLAGSRLRVRAVPDVPSIAAAEFGRNQMRYAWHRAAQYSDVVTKMPPRADYILFSEVWTDHGRVAAIHLFLVTPAGQIAYCRWLNSHHFGKDPLPFDGGAWVDVAARRMLRDFTRTPEELFPPYGVG